MSEERRFPICGVAGMTIPWGVAEVAHIEYAKRYGGSHAQTLERLGERGGFYISEMDMLYPGWRDAVLGYDKLKAERNEAREEVEEWRSGLEASFGIATASPRATLLQLAKDTEDHHQEHHRREDELEDLISEYQKAFHDARDAILYCRGPLQELHNPDTVNDVLAVLDEAFQGLV